MKTTLPAHVCRAAAVLPLLALPLGCTGARPRFEPSVQTVVAQSDMRKLETDELVIYYAEADRDNALRAASRIERCTRAVRAAAQLHSGWTDQKLHIVLPSVPMNNAYVAPPVAGEPISVVPTYNTTDVFGLLGLPPDPGVIGCHEAVHYVQSLQAAGFNGFLALVFGAVYTPQIGLDAWFQEGLATYYETRLQRGIGRLNSRFFEGILAAGVAETGIDTGMFHRDHRRPLYGGPYLLGSFFIDWLATNHGEKSLWNLVAEQGRYVMFPFALERRFSFVYGESLTTLAKAFARDLQKRYPQRQRPDSQRPVAELGADARYAWGPAGLEAFVQHDLDRPTTLTVRRNGAVLFERGLVDVLPGRTLVRPVVSLLSGMSFTSDGAKLYFVVADQGELVQHARLVRVDVATGALEIAIRDLGGPGGAVSPDGTRYLFSRAHGDSYGIASVDIGTAQGAWIRGTEPGNFYLWPRYSPDGRRIVATRTDRQGFWVEVLDAQDGRTLAQLTPRDGQAITPTWVDNDRIAYSEPQEGRMQVRVVASTGGQPTTVTRAPYLAWLAQSDGASLRFLNRDGWHYTVDEIPLPAGAGAAGAAVQPPARWPSYFSYAAARAEGTQDVPLRVRSDAPYSAWDGFFRPQARGVWMQSRPGQSTALGVGALGGDRLGLHRWSLGAGYDTVSQLVSGQFGYLNSQLAPVSLGLDVAHYGSRETTPSSESSGALNVMETVGALLASRTWYGSTSVATGLRFDGLWRSVPNASAPFDSRQFAGYVLALEYAAAEATAYTRLRRALQMSAVSTMFPNVFDSQDYPVLDNRAELATTLPLARRLMVDAQVRARRLTGPRQGDTLLQIGGTGGGVPLSGASEGQTGQAVRDVGKLPPGLRFLETLSGFENLALYDRGATFGELALRYPLIVDWGSLSSLYIFPSFLLRQVDFELFGAGAWLADGRRAAGAVGGRATLRTTFWVLPMSWQMQLARRMTDDEKFALFMTLLVE
jgi:hypothetical protein